ncbi:MAG: MATE family efflux transporter [Tissierellia bacterium]|nr:MATE family efflux transporter [Tissierellia bacterium]
MKRFLRFTIPSILAMWIFSLYTMIDGYFVANYVGPVEFSAINLSLPIVTSFFALGILFSIGIQALIGQALGAKKTQRANLIFTTGFLSLLAFSLVYVLLLALFFRPLLHFLGANASSYGPLKSYLGILLPFGLFFMVSYQLEVLVKVDGFPLVSTLGVLSAALTNVVLDYVFIVQLQLGIFGAGLATGLAQLVSSLVFLSHFLRKKGRLHFVKGLDPAILKKALPLGLGDALTEVALGYTVFLYNISLLKVFGQKGVIAYTLVSYVSSFVSVTMSGISQGLAPLFAYDYGKREVQKIKKSFLQGLAFVGLVNLLAGLVLVLYSQDIIGLFFDPTSPLADFSQDFLSRYAWAYPFIGFNILCISFFASLGQGRIALTISFLRSILVLSLMVGLATYLLKGVSLYYALAASEATTGLVSLFFLKKYALDPLKAYKKETP